jgi:uncharacterized membrane protein YkgB
MIEGPSTERKPANNREALVPVQAAARVNWRKVMKFLISAILVLAIIGTLAALVKFMIGAIGAVLGIILLVGLLSFFIDSPQT